MIGTTFITFAVVSIYFRNSWLYVERIDERGFFYTSDLAEAMQFSSEAHIEEVLGTQLRKSKLIFKIETYNKY